MHAYTDALLLEMQARAEEAKGRVFDTVFFGGGTPSLLPLSDTARLMAAIRTLFTLKENAEITLEVNPKTADKEKLTAFLSMGFNRLSVGVQSLIDRELSLLGRLHSATDARDILCAARAAGFQNVSVDLMYGIPAQSTESLCQTLSEILSFSPEHISAYSLIVEEGTPFYRMQKELALPDEDTEDALHALIEKTLKENGYIHYEISNYAKAGFSSRHNTHYWRAEEYLGLGLSAVSFWKGERRTNTRNMEKYLRSPASSVEESERPTEGELAYEHVMLGLRLREGIDTDAYEARFAIKLKEKHKATLDRYKALGILCEDGSRLFLTEKGMRFSNAVLVSLMEEF